ncbi:glycine betaine ABC transporter substrate-binding protein [Corynebacterium halotolerans]|uniref:glycine betaine ABC transporter substrate-binding protein n=1 Tax=Corynebacterium halotolerans TaxID=225326 RepID=UPI003CF156A7
MTDESPIIYGRINESFHQVGAAVVEEVLLRLGHEVEVHEGPHPEMYPKIASGEHHLFADAWLPGGHAVYWEQVKDEVVEVAPLYDDAKFFWAVPDYVDENIRSLSDLAKPEVAERFTTRTVQGTGSYAGLTMMGDELLETYGLAELGWSQPAGDIHAVIDTVNSRFAAGDWFVTPLWQPMFLNEVHELRPLEDPEGAFPAPDRASLLAHRGAWENLPERTREVLGRIRFDVSDVNEMDLLVNVEGLDILPAIREWVQRHPDTLDAWFN